MYFACTPQVLLRHDKLQNAVIALRRIQFIQGSLDLLQLTYTVQILLIFPDIGFPPLVALLLLTPVIELLQGVRQTVSVAAAYDSLLGIFQNVYLLVRVILPVCLKIHSEAYIVNKL